MGHCYGARMKRVSPIAGMRRLRFLREYPLAPGITECDVYQNHTYELIAPLPDGMENYATDDGSVQAVRITGTDRYGVQFHPEASGEPALGILRAFVSLCARGG